MERVSRDRKDIRERMYKHKWQELKKRGINPPASEEERKERLKAAHGE